jgi:S-(hydroxymethyl)glutathione dehydrogenase/alcohol dehydrogenase
MVYRGPYRVRVEEKDRPSIEHPNDAIVRVTQAAICGSDLHLYHGMMPDTRVGMTFGHEFIGVVDEVGSSVQNLKAGDVVVVFGAGPVGLFAAKSAWLMGAGRVIVVDHLEYRLAKAATFAQAEVCNFVEYDDIVVHLKKITDHLGADVVIDAVGAEADGNLIQHVSAAKFKLQGGSPVALNWAIDSVRKCGTVSVMGAYGPMFSAVKFGDAMNKGLTLRMNQCPVKRQWPRLFEHVRNGYLKPNDIVTHRIPLAHIAEGYHIFSAKLDGCIKPIIVADGT